MDMHHQCAEVLRRIASWQLSLEPGVTPVADLRALEPRVLREFALEPEPLAEIREVQIPSQGRQIAARAFRPTDGVAEGVLVWLHGGGWVLGTVEGSAGVASTLANASGCVVLSVDYRLAPEHRYPAAIDDVFEAVMWAAANPHGLDAKPGALAVAGDSSGGTLAAAVALMARDRGGPPIDFQLLINPPMRRDLDTESRRRYADGYFLTPSLMDWYWQEYLGDDPAHATSPYSSPLIAESLAGLPPAMVILPECDILHDEGHLYADRLAADGVPVDVRECAGMLHGFVMWSRAVDLARPLMREAGAAVGEAVRKPLPPSDRAAIADGSHDPVHPL